MGGKLKVKEPVFEIPNDPAYVVHRVRRMGFYKHGLNRTWNEWFFADKKSAETFVSEMLEKDKQARKSYNQCGGYEYDTFNGLKGWFNHKNHVCLLLDEVYVKK